VQTVARSQGGAPPKVPAADKIPYVLAYHEIIEGNLRKTEIYDP